MRWMDREADHDLQTDATLMQRYAQGDAAAFEALYRRHELRVWRFILRMVRDQALAEELMQDVWFAVAREAVRYRPVAKFTTWLLTLAHHRVVDSFRTAKQHVSLDAPDADGDTLGDRVAADSGFGPLRQVESREQAAALLDAVAALPADQREAFLLQAEGGMSVEEIAAATGAAFETARSRLRYARSKLREHLREYA